jgi:uncharacterized protein YqhQ
MSESKMPHYGGQALIEGVLMRGKNYLVASFRNPQGEIVSEQEELQGIYKSGLAKVPFFRGLIILWDSLVLGMKYITLSANLQAEEEEEKIEGTSLILTMLVSVALAVGLFFILPTVIAELLSKWFQASHLTNNVIEGFVRLALLIGYIWAIGRAEDIARVFAYHGAEHKTINAYEDGVEINVENVMKYPVAHPRCGTAFLLTLVILSILVFSLLGPMTIWLKILSRVLLIPVLAMLSYELIRWMGDHQENKLVKIMVAPNLALQKLTTREPDAKMVEVAISSFKQLLQLEGSN